MTEPSRGETIQPSHRHAIGYPLSTERVRSPVDSGIAKRVYRHTSQDVCPYTHQFPRARADAPPFGPRAALAGKDARSLALKSLSMSQPEFSAAFNGSPMKRAKLRGLKRNAAVVLGNAGTAEDVNVLTRASDGPEPLVREHAARALAQVAARR